MPLYEWIDQLLCQKDEFVVAYCDINHFKPFNDAFGYACGDEVIILLADAKHSAKSLGGNQVFLSRRRAPVAFELA